MEKVIVFDSQNFKGDIGDNSCYYKEATVIRERVSHYPHSKGEILVDVRFPDGRESNGHFKSGVRFVSPSEDKTAIEAEYGGDYVAILEPVVSGDDNPITTERKGDTGLLPCPFCGTQPEWVNEALADSHYYLRCPHCQFTMKQDRRDKVIGFWNNRAPESTPVIEQKEEQPYFTISRNDYGKGFLYYNPSEEVGRFKCWMPLDEDLYLAIEKLLKPESKQLTPDGWIKIETGQLLNVEGHGFMFATDKNTSEVKCFSVSLIPNLEQHDR